MDGESTPKNKPHVRPKQRSDARTPPAAQPPYYEDEISLLDLWLVLVRRKNVLGMVFLLFVAAGVAAALLLPEKYRYTSVVEIGTRILDKQAQPIEDTATVLAKVTETYVPLAQGEYINTHSDKATICQVSTKIPKSSHILIMESTVTEQGADSCIIIQRSVMEFIVDDHKRISDALRKELELQLTKTKGGLDALRDQYKLLMAWSRRAEDTAALLDKQMGQTKGFVAGAMRNREKAVNEATNETKTMTLLMFADNLRAQSNEQGTVNKIKTQILNMRETAVMMPPTRSLGPISPKRRLIVSLAAVVGLMAGIFSAFFAEFVAKARAQVKS